MSHIQPILGHRGDKACMQGAGQRYQQYKISFLFRLKEDGVDIFMGLWDPINKMKVEEDIKSVGGAKRHLFWVLS